MSFIKSNLRVIIAVSIAIFLIVIGIILIIVNNDNDQNISSIEQDKKEEQIFEITGMSGDDAIEIVKTNFYSSNYEFIVDVTNDSLYKVVAVDKSNSSEIIYFVDPANGKAYVNIDTE